jgi:hypothetical protein
MPLELPEVVEKYIKQFGGDVNLSLKKDSKLMKIVGLFSRLFNPNFDSYITTVGSNIYLSESFPKFPPLVMIEILHHENKHVNSGKKLSFLLFGFCYLFPQILFLLLPIMWAIFGWLAGILCLLFLAPIPAPFRYKFELEAYEVYYLFGKYVYKLNDKDLQSVIQDIVNQLTQKWYYWCWPFPKSIEKDLQKENNNDAEFQRLLKFLKENSLIL